MAAARRDVFPFFRLARELRDQIYEEADAPLRLKCAEACLQHGSTLTLTNAPSRGLLLANKQVRSEYLAARSRKEVSQRLVVKVHQHSKSKALLRDALFGPRDLGQRQQGLSAVAKQLEAVRDIDLHFDEDVPNRYNPCLFDIRRLLSHIVSDPKSCTVSFIKHINMFACSSELRLVSALSTFKNAMEALFDVSAWHQARTKAARINASVLIHMPLFMPYTCNLYSGIDPDGRIPDLIKNHKQNQIVVEVQMSNTESRFIDVRPLPLYKPGSYHQIEKEILEGFLEVYEKERDVEELIADLKAIRIGSKWVVDPLDYAEYVDGRV